MILLLNQTKKRNFFILSKVNNTGFSSMKIDFETTKYLNNFTLTR